MNMKPAFMFGNLKWQS